jgi:hypothetical protein
MVPIVRRGDTKVSYAESDAVVNGMDGYQDNGICLHPVTKTKGIPGIGWVA